MCKSDAKENTCLWFLFTRNVRDVSASQQLCQAVRQILIQKFELLACFKRAARVAFESVQDREIVLSRSQSRIQLRRLPGRFYRVAQFAEVGIGNGYAAVSQRIVGF